MSNKYLHIGMVAVTGVFVVFLGWFSRHSRDAAIQRMERYEFPRHIR